MRLLTALGAGVLFATMLFGALFVLMGIPILLHNYLPYNQAVIYSIIWLFFMMVTIGSTSFYFTEEK